MKRPYEKPTLTDLSLPTARAGWLSEDKNASPMGICHTGYTASPGGCVDGSSPGVSGLCFTGSSDSGGNLCSPGSGVHCSSGSTVLGG